MARQTSVVARAQAPLCNGARPSSTAAASSSITSLRATTGASEREVRILVLASSLDGPVTTADQVSVGGQRYAVTAVDRDPAGAVFDLRAQRA